MAKLLDLSTSVAHCFNNAIPEHANVTKGQAMSACKSSNTYKGGNNFPSPTGSTQIERDTHDPSRLVKGLIATVPCNPRGRLQDTSARKTQMSEVPDSTNKDCFIDHADNAFTTSNVCPRSRIQAEA